MRKPENNISLASKTLGGGLAAEGCEKCGLGVFGSRVAVGCEKYGQGAQV
jgi:hypothetical protein